ncbi:MAG TPA: ABC transporter substrate-binding protein, partial [Lachnospiraceae bacterium]|nr:ABC transporter substrate-binding protein [Lachnospiraceae bacterium]
NAELEIQYVEWADWQTQYNLLLASGDDTIDLITTATDWLDAWPNIKKGSFMPLTEDMLKTYAPQTFATVPAENWDKCSYDGQIYLVPEDNYTQYTNHGLYYRGDWAKEFGLSTVSSFADFGKYLQGVKDNKQDVVPWDVSGTAANGNALAGGYIQSNTSNIVIEGVPIGLSTLFYGASKDDAYTVVSPYMDGTTFEDFAVMMKQWADAGYWREDVLNYDGDTREEFKTGSTGADQHHTQTYVTDVRPNMDIKQPGSDVQMFSFSEPSKNLVKTSITHGCVAIGANSKHPERALMVYDLLRNDEECYKLINYGIEGSDYILTSDGKLDRPEGWDESVDGLGSNFWCGRNDDLELENARHYAGKTDIYANYDTYAIDYPYGKFVFDNSNVSTQIAAMADVCANYIPRIAFGKVDDPKALVAEFREQLKAAGYDDVLKEVQNQLNASK